MNEDVEIHLPKQQGKAPIQRDDKPPTVNLYLGDSVKVPFERLIEVIKNQPRPPEEQKVRGVVTLDDKQVEVDLEQVVEAINRLEETTKQDKNVTVKNQADLSGQFTELKTSITKAIKAASEQKAPEVFVNQPEDIKATIKNKKPSEAIPVTLTDKAQKKFVEAMAQVITQGGGGGFPSQIAVTNPDGSNISGGGGGGGSDSVNIEDTTDTQINPATKELQTTANTKLDEAKTKLDSIISNTDGLEGMTDGLEGLLTDLKGLVDGLESGISGLATQTTLASVLTAVDGIETLLSDIDSGKLEETTFTGRIGEVQTTPTANTVLSRLKAINDSLGSLTVTVGEIEVKNDSGNPVPVSSSTLSTSAKQDTAQTSLTAIEGYVDGLEGGTGAAADAAATAGSTGSLSAKQRLMTSQLDSIKTAAEKIDDIVSGAGANITQVGGTNIDTNSGNKSAGTQRVVVATDQPAVPTSIGAATTGGATPYKLISAATTNATSVKGSAGTIYAVQVFNTNASPRYLKFYNKATAPTVGTDIPVKIVTIPGNAAGSGVVIPMGIPGINFDTGIGFALTTGVADADTGAVAANEIVVNLDYK